MKTRGFTLIEVVVAMGIFSVMLLIIVGVFSRFVQIQRRQIGEQQLQEDIRLAMDLFNKEARTGFGDTFPSGSFSGEIQFRNQNNQCVRYSLDGGRLARSAVDMSDFGGLGCDDVAYNDEKITGGKTFIDSLKFYSIPATVDAATSKLTSQGLIMVAIKAHAIQKASAVITWQSSVASHQTLPAP